MKKGILVFIFLTLNLIGNDCECFLSESEKEKRIETYGKYIDNLFKEKMIGEVTIFKDGACIYNSTIYTIGFINGAIPTLLLKEKRELSYEEFLEFFIKVRNNKINSCLNK